jgi:hypothetical protein
LLKRTHYLRLLAEDTRQRHEHFRDGSGVLGFCVQLEVLVQGQWRPVVRFDTAHGLSHKDILHANGSAEKKALPASDLKHALNFAEYDLLENWQQYRVRFLDEVGHDRK